jgi:hypothetical protein
VRVGHRVADVDEFRHRQRARAAEAQPDPGSPARPATVRVTQHGQKCIHTRPEEQPFSQNAVGALQTQRSVAWSVASDRPVAENVHAATRRARPRDSGLAPAARAIAQWMSESRFTGPTTSEPAGGRRAVAHPRTSDLR